MKTAIRLTLAVAMLGGLLGLTTQGFAADDESKAVKIPGVSLLNALRSGEVAVEAEGLDDGRMTIAVTNRTDRQLNVVLPPGLIASGATGQYGGMGGMGGGLGGMGGGGMAGGGVGGIGGGNMGVSGGTVPASMGVMMLGRLIMRLVGDRDSWDQTAPMTGGAGAGGISLMGGGFRSVPPTGTPHAMLEPGQTRNLPTRLVSLNGPTDDARATLPAKGEKLQLGDIGQLTQDGRTQAALRRLAEDKAPTVISQLVLWNVGAGLDWNTIAMISKNWANAHEVTLARQFVASLDAPAKDDSGRIFVEVRGTGELAGEVRKLFREYTVLGLKVEAGVPARPPGSALACTIVLGPSGEASVLVQTSNGQGSAWTSSGKFSAPSVTKDGRLDAPAFADSVASGVLGRMVDAKLVKGKKLKGKDTYTVRIDNYSPLILNGLALAGVGEKSAEAPKLLSGICLSPRRSLTVPASPEVVEQLGLKEGVRVLAADLSGL